MKIVALEEHLTSAAIVNAWDRLPFDRRDDSVLTLNIGDVARQLNDLGDERVRLMDESGVDVQVLSLTTPGTQNLDPAEALPLARDVNDLIAATVKRRPDRFEGFATLPTASPGAAARELERSVNELGLCGAMLFGRTGDMNLDDTALRPVFEAAAALRVPLYIHPQIPVQAVRKAYYDGFGHDISLALATGAPGWHYETGIQLLRLVLAGTFDRHPHLQVIVGHWGELVLFFLERINLISTFSLNLEQPLLHYFQQNVSYTPSGIFSQRYLRWAVEVVGVERLLFSTDYPFQHTQDLGARRFLQDADLSDSQRALFAFGNWERMRDASRGGGFAAVGAEHNAMPAGSPAGSGARGSLPGG